MTTAVLLTVQEIAEIFRTSRAAVYARLCRARKGLDDFPLPCFGKGKRCYWTQTSINDFFTAREQKPSAPSPQGKRQLSDTTRDTLQKHGILPK
jgi:predicted DNA-binding transcriptional regulator AlpA